MALLLFGGASAFYSYQEYQRTQQREQERLLAQAHVIQENVSQNLVAVNQVLLNIQTQLQLRRSAGREFDFYLRTLSDAMPSVRTLIVLDADGSVYATSRPELIGRNFLQRDYFQEARRRPSAETLFVSAPFHTSLGIYAVAVSKVIPGPHGEFNGLVTATLDPDYLAPLLESIRYTPDIVTSLVHWNGLRVLIRPEQKGALEKNLLQPGTFFSRHRESKQEATVFSGVLYSNGEERMIVQRTINPEGLNMDRPLVVAVSRRLEDIYATWHRDMRAIGVLFGLLTIVSVAGLYLYQRKQREFALKEAEAVRLIEASDRFMKTMTDHLPSMVGYWTDELRCRFSNAVHQEWFGKTVEQMRDIRMPDLLGQRLFAEIEAVVRAALRGERQQFELILTKADGSTAQVWAQYIPDWEGNRVKGFVALVSDISKLKQAEIARAESEWKLKTIIEAEPECVTVLTADSTIQQMNRAGLDMLGVESEQQILGCNLSEMVVPRYRASFNELSANVNGGASGVVVFELIGKKGAQRWLESHAVPMRDKNGSITGSLCVMRDITERKKAEDELEKLAHTDFLTGLPNRRHFLALAEQEVARTKRYGGALSVLMMDIDHFKKINDRYGHLGGDKVLQMFAQLCRSAVRNVDILGRLGGEEFAALLPQTDGPRAMEVAGRLREIIAQAEVLQEQGAAMRFTLSIGVASEIDASANIDALLSRADAALYDAKNGGRNKVCFYEHCG